MATSLGIEGLEKNYDAVVLGTNLAPSIIAAAAGFSGHTVLHLDANDFYGHLDDATFTFDQAVEWAQQLSNNTVSIEKSQDENMLTRISDSLGATRTDKVENLRIVRMNQNPLECAHVFSFGANNDDVEKKEEVAESPYVDPIEVSVKEESSEEVRPCMADVEKTSRRFCIDIGNPMAIFANGASVDLMVKSGVGRYLEFLSMDSLNIFEKGNSWRVPCSKRDIFSSKELSVMEKNRLMKLLRFVMDWGVVNVAGSTDLSTQDDMELKAGRSLHRPQNSAVVDPSLAVDGEASFVEYLTTWNISDKLRDAILYAIALLPDSQADSQGVSAFDGLAATYRHLSALNHYGNTGLLSPLYGSGEISQAFCRLCAVSRGTYILRHALYGVVVETRQGEEHVVGVCDQEGNLVTTPRFICNGDYLRVRRVWDDVADLEEGWTVRRACILDGAVSDGKSLTVIKPNTQGVGNHAPISVMQSDDST